MGERAVGTRAVAVPWPVRPRGAARRRGLADDAYRGLLTAFALFVFVVAALIVYESARGSVLSIRTFGWGFFVSTEWDPVADRFGLGSAARLGGNRPAGSRQGRAPREGAAPGPARHPCEAGLELGIIDDSGQPASRPERCARNCARFHWDSVPRFRGMTFSGSEQPPADRGARPEGGRSPGGENESP